MIGNFAKLLASVSAPTPDRPVQSPTEAPSELDRILRLPIRPPPDKATLEGWAAGLKAELGANIGQPCQCETKYHRPCCANLLPVQTWALHEIREVGGLVGPIGVGHGKTLLDLLAPMVLKDCKRAALLLPPNLRTQLLDVDWGYYSQHWKLPNLSGGGWLVPGRPTLFVVAFSELSGSRATDLLDRLVVDTLVIDEAHSLRNAEAARTKRFRRYVKSRPDLRVLAWSGTLVSKSLKDYAHISNAALKEGSPVPRVYNVLEEWAAILDPSDIPQRPGVLSIFGPDPRAGFSRRLHATPGVVGSGDSASCQASLTIEERKVKVPKEIKDALKNLEKTWERPDGEELVTALDIARSARELASGFYYRWIWPRGESRETIVTWLLARKAWHKELREKLKSAKVHLDSPLLLSNAARRWYEGYKHEGKVYPPRTKEGPLATWRSETWQEWLRVRDSAEPSTEAVWISDFLVQDAAAWLADGAGLCWYEHDAFAQRLLAVANARGVRELVFAGPGALGDRAVAGLRGTEAVVCSIRAHGTGKNLQPFARNLVANPPSSGATWEQLLGRTHRTGQLADEVTVEVYRHAECLREAVETARDLSQYIETTLSATQRLASVAHWGF